MLQIYVTPPVVDYDDRILPDTIISDEYLSNIISIRGSKNEIIPATFILKSNVDVDDVLISSSDFMDIRVVKCWYQNGHEIWGDKIEFLPELLLKDDSLIMVDHANQDNYAKLTNGTYLWISERTYDYHPLSPTVDEFPIQDSDVLQSVTLVTNENKQFWITIDTLGLSPGEHVGNIDIGDLGTITVFLTVLPITLIDSDIEGSLYYTARLDNAWPEGKIGNSPRSEEQMLAEFKDLKEHGVLNPTSYQGYPWSADSDFDLLGQYMVLRQALGLNCTDFYWYGMHIWQYGENYAELQNKYIEVKDFLSQYGVENLYIYGTDERNMDNPVNRAQIDAIHAVDGKVFCAQSQSLAEDIADVLDLCVLSYSVDDTYFADLYHSYGHKLFSYANPQVGLEQPLKYRRNYGIYLWQKDFDGGMTYAYHKGSGNLWNDWDGVYDCYPPECDPERHPRYKQHVFAYPTLNGVVDTLQWEGFREGATDLKYLATLEKTIAEAKARGKDTSEAEMYIDNLKTITLADVNMDAVRLDLANYILSLQPTIDSTHIFIIAVISLAAIIGVFLLGKKR